MERGERNEGVQLARQVQRKVVVRRTMNARA
jgi:hypothetical protein